MPTQPARHPFTTIYALRDPRRRDEARYVGKTVAHLASRLTGHLYQAKIGNPRQVYRWIRSLWQVDLIPEIVELERCPTHQWQTRERHWIKQAKLAKMRLTNLTNGGVSMPRDAARAFYRRKAAITYQTD